VKLNRWMKVFFISGCMVALAACSSAHKSQNGAVSDANSAYNSDAQASGLGDESGFGSDQAGGRGLSQRVYHFDFDSYTVRDEDKPAIEANADYLLAHHNAKVLLEGHTDPKGSREYNIALGERRAKAVQQILTSRGVNPSQIRVVSYGSQKLAAPGHSEEAYQEDRRVVLAYLQR
jgi:peptidoglycan-associated lipoprotein